MTMEIKQEIAHIVDTLPEEVLGEVLTYLRQMEKTVPAKTQLDTHLATILSEDREVLARLAK